MATVWVGQRDAASRDAVASPCRRNCQGLSPLSGTVYLYPPHSPTSRRPRNEKPLAGSIQEQSHAQAMPTMSNELEYRSASLGRSSTTTATQSTSKRPSFSIPSKKQNQKLIELRPKGERNCLVFQKHTAVGGV
ncbi:hypothetical protein BDW67DRAFT_162568 [Aspergillus spinulosporus]